MHFFSNGTFFSSNGTAAMISFSFGIVILLLPMGAAELSIAIFVAVFVAVFVPLASGWVAGTVFSGTVFSGAAFSGAVFGATSMVPERL